MKRLIPIAVIAAALVWTLLASQQRTGPVVVSGFVEADEIRVGSRVGGRVLRVLVEEGQSVVARETLVELEPFDLLERRAPSEQVLAQMAAEHDRLKAGFRTEEIAQAALNAIERQIDELTIVAPADAIVEAIDLQPGDLVAPNAPAVSLVDRRRLNHDAATRHPESWPGLWQCF